MATYVKVGGTWKTVTTDSPTNGICGYVKVNGTWRTVNQSYVKINGTWRSVCTAPGQQPIAVQQNICYRPNYCNNGTNGIISPTTEPCYLTDGSLGSRTAPYTCQTDSGCVSYTVPAGVCSKPNPIISVVSEQIGDCEFWGGISGCTNGYGKRITTTYSDSSLKVSYRCCDPLTGNVKYYCTLRPYSTGTCLNELKNEDITGTVVAGSGEWVCEAAGITTFPSCKTTENCTNPKSTSAYYEGCGYLGTGQRLVTTNTYQSWCDTTQSTVIGDCVGEIPKCGGAYCGEGSGEEEYALATCPSGSGIRYKCVTPEGCDNVYTFRRCTTYSPPAPPSTPSTQYLVTEICVSGPNSSTTASCRQYSTYSAVSDPTDPFCYNRISTDGQYVACPSDTPAASNPTPTGNCSTCNTTYTANCTTSAGGSGTQTVCVTPAACPNIYGTCTATAASTDCSACVFGSGTRSCGTAGTQTYCITPVGCPDIYGPCNEPSPPAPVVDCSACTYGSGTRSCGNGGTQTYCITPVGCPNIYGTCEVPSPPAPVTPPSNPCSSRAGQGCGRYGNGTVSCSGSCSGDRCC